LYDRRTVSVHMTDLCNSRCRFCGEGSHERVVDSVDKGAILRHLKSYDTSEWTMLNIHGGEPTVSPHLLEVLRRGKELGFSRIVLQTNAMRIGSDPAYADEVDSAGVDLYTIGFHGSRDDVMDAITRVPGSFARGLKGARAVIRRGKPVRMTFVVCAQNYRDLPDLAALAASEGVSHLNISAMQPDGSAAGDLDGLIVRYAEAAPYIEKAAAKALEGKARVTLEGFPFCALKGHEALQVDWPSQCLKVHYREMVIDDFNKFLNATIRSYGAPCESCLARGACGGVYAEYAARRGWDEFVPYE
jgi:MoaA/NifB/PqqE/SkfB family radical SAM enzyme